MSSERQSGGGAGLDEQDLVRENVGQFDPAVRYGFRTQFGGMLVYDDHVRIVSTRRTRRRCGG
jgi:hypothetical protein